MDVGDLGVRLAGDLVLPGDERWDTARQAWNLAVDQRPVAIVYPESAEDVAQTVRFAAERGLRIAFNAGGHNAGPIDWSRDTLLLKTERMRRIEIDAAARRARIEAGVQGKPLALAAAEHGLAYLSGTSPDVGVVGYSLGGGLSWM
ncbi:MAG TPA: FAD-dependent oxidoreductase, partial [Candidatus Limnocylindrales bacterium]